MFLFIGLITGAYLTWNLMNPLSSEDSGPIPSPVALNQVDPQTLENIKQNLSKVFSQDLEDWPQFLQDREKVLHITYTFDQELTQFIKKIQAQYASDYSAIVVVDNNTGEVLSAIGYDGRQKHFNYQLAYSSSHPSASLFKIVTSADLIQNTKVGPETLFQYTGRSTTLYRSQLKESSPRWSRGQTLARAFAASNNNIGAGGVLITKSKLLSVKYVISTGRTTPC